MMIIMIGNYGTDETRITELLTDLTGTQILFHMVKGSTLESFSNPETAEGGLVFRAIDQLQADALVWLDQQRQRAAVRRRPGEARGLRDLKQLLAEKDGAIWLDTAGCSAEVTAAMLAEALTAKADPEKE